MVVWYDPVPFGALGYAANKNKKKIKGALDSFYFHKSMPGSRRRFAFPYESLAKFPWRCY